MSEKPPEDEFIAALEEGEETRLKVWGRGGDEVIIGGPRNQVRRYTDEDLDRIRARLRPDNHPEDADDGLGGGSGLDEGGTPDPEV